MYLTKRIFYALFLMCFVLLASCNDDDEDDTQQPGIVGTWRLTDAELTFNDQSIRDFFEQYYSEQGIDVTDEELDQIEAAFNEGLGGAFDEGATFEFQSNGTLIVDSADDTTDSQATWEVTDDNILIISDGTDATEFTITTLNNSELRLLFEEEEELDLGSENPENVTVGLTLTFDKQ